MAPTSEFRSAGIIGLPIMQSRSPALYGWWREKYGISGAYLPMPVQPAHLEDAARGLRALGFVGWNVTMPHKIAMMKLVDRVDPVAQKIGAVNLVIVEADGSLSAYNTDGEGFLASIVEAAPNWRPSSGTILILGAGGAASAILASLVAAGATDIRLCNRTRARAEALAAVHGAVVTVVPWEQRSEAADGAALLINTTSLGFPGKGELEISLDALPPDAVVSDIIYNPWETPLLAKARARGHVIVNGLGMLLHQAVPCFERYWGLRPQVTPELYQAIRATL